MLKTLWILCCCRLRRLFHCDHLAQKAVPPPLPKPKAKPRPARKKPRKAKP